MRPVVIPSLENLRVLALVSVLFAVILGLMLR